MLKKIKNFCFNEWTINWVVLGCLFVVIVGTCTVGFNDFVKPIFNYPEEEYQILEMEACRIIEEQTLSTEFVHEINYSNNLETKSIDITLWGNGARVKIDVDNYGEESEYVKVSRNQENGAGYHINTVLVLILCIMMLAFILSCFVMAILFILGAVCKFLDWMFRAIRY